MVFVDRVEGFAAVGGEFSGGGGVKVGAGGEARESVGFVRSFLFSVPERLGIIPVGGPIFGVLDGFRGVLVVEWRALACPIVGLFGGLARRFGLRLPGVRAWFRVVPDGGFPVCVQWLGTFGAGVVDGRCELGLPLASQCCDRGMRLAITCRLPIAPYDTWTCEPGLTGSW
ncbi:hypothetical protein D0T12_23185 [Actinomadura spongiicola]|uniref:Uncharacterized protein n=1 Tax=Actinomadura spongiicola TaxID=2303421 RepID=A0A372GD79_9ACTN|nr:hypothetical protein D0T12_23185 [Actinomadura spongiicola]